MMSQSYLVKVNAQALCVYSKIGDKDHNRLIQDSVDQKSDKYLIL